jgi:hypothetical protein
MTSGSARWQPEDDWSLLVGRQIEIHEQGKVLDWGRVENVTMDGNILWLEMDGPRCRRLIEKSPVRHVKAL